MYIQEENKNRMNDATNVDPVFVNKVVEATFDNLKGRGIETGPSSAANPAAKPDGGVTDTQPKKSKAELIAEAEAELAAAGEDEEKKQTAQAKLDEANAMQDEVPGPDAAADAIDPQVLRTQKQEQVNVLEEEKKTMPDGDEKTKKQAEIDKLKEEIEAIKGGRRRTRRRNKKSGKKSRRQSKKGGKKHRNTGSKKSKKSRRYSSRK